MALRGQGTTIEFSQLSAKSPIKLMSYNCRTCDKPFDAGISIDVTGILCPECIDQIGYGICPNCNSTLDWKKRGKYMRIGVTSGNWICSDSNCGFRINEIMMTAFLRKKMAQIRLDRIKDRFNLYFRYKIKTKIILT